MDISQDMAQEFEAFKKFMEMRSKTLVQSPETLKPSDDPMNEISWPDFWKKVGDVIGKDVLPPVVMKFASFLKGMRDMNTWKNDEILDVYKGWTPTEKVKEVKEVKEKKEKVKAPKEKVKEEVKEEKKEVKEEKSKEEKPKEEKPKEEKPKEEEKPKAPKEVKAPKEKKSPKEKVTDDKAQAEADAKAKAQAEAQAEADAKAKAQAEVDAKAKAETDKKVSKKVKTDVWNTFIGEGIANHKCLCCKMTTIDKASFDCGHVLSRAEGGGPEIHNLRPICSGCNNGMGTMNMIEYVKKHGYYIGGGR
jgi:hypothetical protein